MEIFHRCGSIDSLIRLISNETKLITFEFLPRDEQRLVYRLKCLILLIFRLAPCLDDRPELVDALFDPFLFSTIVVIIL